MNPGTDAAEGGIFRKWLNGRVNFRASNVRFWILEGWWNSWLFRRTVVKHMLLFHDVQCWVSDVLVGGPKKCVMMGKVRVNEHSTVPICEWDCRAEVWHYWVNKKVQNERCNMLPTCQFWTMRASGYDKKTMAAPLRMCDDAMTEMVRAFKPRFGFGLSVRVLVSVGLAMNATFEEYSIDIDNKTCPLHGSIIRCLNGQTCLRWGEGLQIGRLQEKHKQATSKRVSEDADHNCENGQLTPMEVELR